MAKGRAQFIEEHGGSQATFNLVDEPTVKRMKKDGVVKLPSKRVSVPKDMRWNEKQMTSKVLAGIESGDSVAKMAGSMASVVDNNMTSAFRNARTMTTSAENHGRLDSYQSLEDQGVIQQKVWIATDDERTRLEHLFMDGETANIDEPFSNGLMFPGDGDGDPEEVWNCRCTMEDRILGFVDEYWNFKATDPSFVIDDTGHGDRIMAEMDRRAEIELARQEAALARQEATSLTVTETREVSSVGASEASANPADYNKWPEAKNVEAYNSMVVEPGAEDMIYGWEGYVGTGNSFDINYAMRYDQIETLSEHNKEVINVLTRTIEANQLEENVQLARMVGGTYMENTFGIPRAEIRNYIANYDLYEKELQGFIGTVVEEKGFMSVSTNIEKNVFTDRPVTLEILAPKGTNAYVTNNFAESEVVLKPNQRYKITGIRKDADRWGNEKLVLTALII